MAPKKVLYTKSLFLVMIGENNTVVDSIHASQESALECKAHLDSGNDGATIESTDIIGGMVIADANVIEKNSSKATKIETSDEDVSDDEAGKPEVTLKTKPVAKQLTEKVKKAKKGAEDDLPANFQALLAGSGGALKGLTIVVTGKPPMLGRKNAEKLIESYGGKIVKKVSTKTDYVVLGNDAGPIKLEEINKLGIDTMDEQHFVQFIEDRVDQATSSDTDDEGSEKEAMPMTKKRKTRA